MSDNLVGAKLGNYRLERLLGRGRMGVVYLARDEALLRPTAVKILSWTLPEQTGQNPEAWFLAEARNVARVNHPHVVQIYGVARHGSYCYIAMEYVEGASADVWIEKNGPFSPERATEILIQTAGALQAAHDANVVHRDIKPENVLVGSDGKAKLGDFGMAHHAANNRSADANRAGTPHYTAPEIWRGEGASPSTDIYALGATYHYLLTGRPPYSANDLSELINAHLNAPLPELRGVAGKLPQACQDIFARCMAKTKQQRFPSAQALGFEARAVLRNLTSMPPAPPSSRAPTIPVKALAAPRVPSLAPSSSQQYKSLGFDLEPFGSAEPGHLPYQGEPHLSLGKWLREQLNRPNASPILLTGVPGTGRTCLLTELVARNDYSGQVAHVSCLGSGATRFLATKILRAFGLAPALDRGKSGLVESLVDYCLGLSSQPAPPLVVIDDLEQIGNEVEDLASIVLAAQLSSAFRLVMIGGEETSSVLANSKTLGVQGRWDTIALPVLDTGQVAAYIGDWMTATLTPGRAPILFTPDALLLVARRSGGVLSTINQIAQNMLRSVSAKDKRVLDSWDAWVAPLDASKGHSPSRPPEWPSNEALEVLNDCRRSVGLQSRRQQPGV